MTKAWLRLRWLVSMAASALMLVPALIGGTVSGHPSISGQAALASTLTPQQLAGQRVIYSYTGLTPPPTLVQRIESGQAAGVIFFGDNISSESQIGSVITELRRANDSSPVKAPLLLMTDQEGGQVRRLPGAPTLSEKQIGESADATAVASQAGTGAGQNLAGVGMNVNLAPVLDVYRTPGDFDDQYQRSYSQHPRPSRRWARRSSRRSRPPASPPPSSTSPDWARPPRARTPTPARSRSPCHCPTCAPSTRRPTRRRSRPA